MDIPPDAPRQLGWDLGPEVAAQLASAVDDLHEATGRPRHEIVSAVIAVGLSYREEIEARLAERQLAAVIASLPSDSRPTAPDLLAYDRLLGRRPQHGLGATALPATPPRRQLEAPANQVMSPVP